MPGVVYIKTQTAKVGALDTSSRDSAVEFAEVMAVGEMPGKSKCLDSCMVCPTESISNFDFKVGDKIFVKSWGIDIITHEGVRYEFVNIATGAIVAKVHEDKMKDFLAINVPLAGADLIPPDESN